MSERRRTMAPSAEQGLHTSPVLPTSPFGWIKALFQISALQVFGLQTFMTSDPPPGSSLSTCL